MWPTQPAPPFQATLTEQVRAHPNISRSSSTSPVDLIIGARSAARTRAALAPTSSTSPTTSAHLRRPPHRARHRRRRQVYLYTTNPDTATGDGGRDGLAARAAGFRTWNSSSSTPPACITPGQVLPDLRSRPRRRRPLPPPDGSHFMPEHDPRRNSPRDIVARNRLRDEEARPGLRLPRHQPQTRRFSGVPLPEHPRPLPRVGHRHHAPADPVVRRFSCGGIVTDLQGPHRRRRPACDRRDRLHGSPRRQPAGQQLACSNAWSSARPPPPTSSPTAGTGGQTCPSGTKAA